MLVVKVNPFWFLEKYFLNGEVRCFARRQNVIRDALRGVGAGAYAWSFFNKIKSFI